MLRRGNPGQSAIEAAVLIFVAMTALGIFYGFMRAAVSDRMKTGADSFGHELLYGKGQVQEGCWSCAVNDFYADAAGCCVAYNGCTKKVQDVVKDGVCGCCPAPPSCWACTGTSGYGKTYSSRDAACAAAQANAQIGCIHAGKPHCGMGACFCTMESSPPCTAG